jgi:molybdopterin synthase sulfur carrier subunit
MPHVRIPPILRPEAGNNRQVEAEGATVREVLDNLVATYPALRDRLYDETGGELPQFLNVFIDGSDVRLLEGLDTPVGAEATVILLPAVAGGRDGLATAPPALRA